MGITFIAVAKIPIGEACRFGDACDDDNGKCLQGTCTCVPGFFARSKACCKFDTVPELYCFLIFYGDTNTFIILPEIAKKTNCLKDGPLTHILESRKSSLFPSSLSFFLSLLSFSPLFLSLKELNVRISIHITVLPCALFCITQTPRYP